MEKAVSQTITDDELRARYGDDAELLIDALDRKVETQKFANFSRDREAVEAALAARLNHEQR
jgi:microcystin degradation protein MlrC